MKGAEQAARELFLAEALVPHGWSNGPGVRYATHTHDYDKVLVCLAGSITFHTPDGDVALEEGGRLDLAAGTPHAATVGPDGVDCLEAVRS